MRHPKARIRSGALLAGPLWAAVVPSLPVPQGLTRPALAAAAVALWMAIWWARGADLPQPLAFPRSRVR
jgi:hypothetical protein